MIECGMLQNTSAVAFAEVAASVKVVVLGAPARYSSLPVAFATAPEKQKLHSVGAPAANPVDVDVVMPWVIADPAVPITRLVPA